MATRHLTEFEGLALLGVEALTELKLEAHGNAIWYWIDDTIPELVSRSGIYDCLRRLELGDFLSCRQGEPKKEPGGRRRQLYHLTAKGKRALETRRYLMQTIWG